jgi:hypothetical protein
MLLAASVAWAGGGGAGGGGGCTRIEGVITAIDADTLQLVVADVTVQVTEQTVIRKSGQAITLSDLALGETVAACGIVEEDVLLANRVTVRPCAVVLTATVAGGQLTPNGGKQLRLVPLSAEEEAGLLLMREEEKLARDVYLTLGELWQLPIFTNIAASEQTHMDAVLALLTRYGLTDPVAGMDVGEFATPEFQALFAELVALGSESLIGALTVGATIEEIDIVDLLEQLEIVTHRDLGRVYQNLERGSENHLRAFVGQLAAQDVVYEPQYLDPELYEQIIGG